MVTLKEIEATGDNLQRRSELVLRWSEERGFKEHPICTFAHMRYIERLEEQVTPITWTTTKPTKPGWYWFKEKLTRPTIVVEVDRRRQSMEPYDGLWVWFTSGRQNRLIDISGEWSIEPIAEPEEVR